MPADLDDIFASVARQADAIPLGTADQARRRGRRRTRNGILAAAAAVCVVLVGVGVAVGADRRTDQKTVAPTPSPSVSLAGVVRPLPLVGKPIAYGRTVKETMPVIVKDRVYTAFADGDKISLIATDLRTGARKWEVSGFEAWAGAVAYVSATDNGVLLSADGTRTWVLDPADGRQRWEFTSGDLDEWVLHQRVLVQRSYETGEVDAHDLVSGRKLWSMSSGANKIDRVLGMRLDGQDQLDTGYTDNRLVVVRRSGQVQVRDILSGAVLRTMTPVSPPTGGTELIAYDGRLYDGGPGCCDTEPYRVVVTDLSTGASKKIFRAEVGHSPGGLAVCGPVQVCLIDREGDTATRVLAVDSIRGGTVWSVLGPSTGSITAFDTTILVGGDGGPAVLLDGNGAELFRTSDGQGEWLDYGRLLVLPPTTGGSGVGGTVMIVNANFSTITRFGGLPPRTGPCAHTADRLVCPTSTDTRIYEIRE